MIKNKNLIIVGDSAFSQIAYEYFQYDSEYDVIAFSVERDYLSKDEMFGLPVVSFEELQNFYNPSTHEVFVATTYTKLNRLRTRLASEVKAMGYRLASYISPHAFVWKNVQIGEHCFIFENNTLQPFVKICNNVILWSGNHIGHHSIIRNNCFISSHVVISGYCDIGENCFIGVNATLSNNVILSKDNWIGPNVLITKSTVPGALYRAKESEKSGISAPKFFKVENL